MSSVDWPEYSRVFGKVSLAELEYIQSRRRSLGIPAEEVTAEAARVAIELDQLKAEKKDPDSFTVAESEPRP